MEHKTLHIAQWIGFRHLYTIFMPTWEILRFTKGEMTYDAVGGLAMQLDATEDARVVDVATRFSAVREPRALRCATDHAVVANCLGRHPASLAGVAAGTIRAGALLSGLVVAAWQPPLAQAGDGFTITVTTEA